MVRHKQKTGRQNLGPVVDSTRKRAQQARCVKMACVWCAYGVRGCSSADVWGLDTLALVKEPPLSPGSKEYCMYSVVISGTGLYQPPHVITNTELVEAFNAYADLQNAKNADAIAAGTHAALTHSSVEFIEKTSGL